MSTLKDLNAHLFAQLDKLAKSNKDDLKEEIQRSEAIKEISKEIVSAHQLQLDAARLIAQYNGLNPQQEAPLISCGNVEI